MITFGVTSAQIKKHLDFAEPVDEYCLISFLKMLAERKLTGNAALTACASIIKTTMKHSHIIYVPILYEIFDKDLKIGVDTKTINEVMGLNIPVFEVALAFDINKSPTYQRRVDKEPYIITRKLDGVRLIAKYDYHQNEIKFYSRIGHEFTSLSVLGDALKDTLRLTGGNCIVDGELCVIENNKENFKEAVSQIKRKDFAMAKPHYKIFDLLTEDEFNGVKSDRPYTLRLAFIDKILKDHPSEFYSPIQHCKYTPESFTMACEIADRKGWEGLILRADAPYQSGRTSDLLKVKKFTDAEFFIEDITTTTKSMLDVVSKHVIPVECAGAVIIRYKGNPVSVGSGIPDALRIEMYNNPDKFLGRPITVKYFEETKDALGKPSLRFPIFKGFRDTME